MSTLNHNPIFWEELHYECTRLLANGHKPVRAIANPVDTIQIALMHDAFPCENLPLLTSHKLPRGVFVVKSVIGG